MRSANLDLLRACAVLSVALSHLYISLGNGARFALLAHNIGVGGVLIFFVHTSLVLLLSLERKQAANRTRSFYIQRAFRILPLCWVCIAFVLITGLSDTPADKIHALGLGGILANVFLVQNFIRVGNVVGPLWSLPWEVQMYLVLPFLFVLVTRRKQPWLSLGIWTATTAGAVLVTALNFPRSLHALVFIPMFIGGLVAYQMRNRSHWLHAGWWPAFVIALIAARAALLRGDSIESGWNVLVNAVICLVLGLSIPLFGELKSASLNAASHTVAEYSYGIYLFHVPMLALCFDHTHLPTWLKVAAWFLATGVIAFALYHTVEKPLMALGKKLTRSTPRNGVATHGAGDGSTIPFTPQLKLVKFE